MDQLIETFDRLNIKWIEMREKQSAKGLCLQTNAK